MATKTHRMSIDDLADAYHLQLIHAATEKTVRGFGLPSMNSPKHVIGFKSYEQAVQFVKEWGGVISLYERRDGASMYTNRGEQNRALTYEDYLQDAGDNYRVYANTAEDIQARKEHLLILLEEEDFAGVSDYILQAEELVRAAENLPDEDFVCIAKYSPSKSDAGNNLFPWVFHVYMPHETMTYKEDVTTYYVGVDLTDVEFDEFSEEEEAEA
jgi:hypothetical protein